MQFVISNGDNAVRLMGDSYVLTAGGCEIWKGDVQDAFVLDLNSGNASIVEATGSDADALTLQFETRFVPKVLTDQEKADAQRRYIYTTQKGMATPASVTTEVSVAPGEYVAVPTIPVRMIPAAVQKGLALIGKSPDGLTVDELAWQKAAVNWELKERLRGLIEIGVGDALDQLANTDKQLQLITGLTVRMYRLVRLVADKMLANETITQEEYDAVIPPEIKGGYDNYADSYDAAVTAGTYKDRSDIENPAVMIPRVMASAGMIAQIVETEYLERLVP
jgi:hypothetical protein